MGDHGGNARLKTMRPALIIALKRVWKPLKIILILLLPILFAISLMVIAPAASALGMFYMRQQLPTQITLMLFPLTWIYLGMRWSVPKKAKIFARNTAVILLLLLSTSTTMETVAVAPMVKIDRAFVTPEGWVKDKVSISPGAGLAGCSEIFYSPVCPEVRSEWKKTGESPITMEEVQTILEANGYNDFTVSENCTNIPDPRYSRTCVLSGKINGQDVSLDYYFPGGHTLSLTVHNPKY